MPNLTAIVILLALLWPTLLPAQDVEIDGLVIDQTRTRIGREFYREFSQRWGQPAGFKGYNIVIRELPSPLQGSSFEVNVNGRTVVRGRLLPKPSDIAQAVTQSIQRVQYHLLLQLNQNHRQGDLQGDGY